MGGLRADPCTRRYVALEIAIFPINIVVFVVFDRCVEPTFLHRQILHLSQHCRDVLALSFEPGLGRIGKWRGNGPFGGVRAWCRFVGHQTHYSVETQVVHLSINLSQNHNNTKTQTSASETIREAPVTELQSALKKRTPTLLGKKTGDRRTDEQADDQTSRMTTPLHKATAFTTGS